jgi:hypothetical protein
VKTESRRPSISGTAFECPHCGAFTTQEWYDLYISKISEDTKVPFVPDDSTRVRIEADKELDDDKRKELVLFVESAKAGLVVALEDKETQYLRKKLFSLFLSKCFNCEKYSVWLKDRLIFPDERDGAQPLPEMPDKIRIDFDEARSIVNASPRGAAALLRLAIQKLCIHLGEKGETLDKDIASLVSKGLNPTVQKSLDIVRVIGNEAVHPGVLDIKDDRQAATTLLDLVNLITEQMITNPRKVEEMYARLPKEKRKAIERRDGKV